jgi:cytochrome c551/c552
MAWGKDGSLFVGETNRGWGSAGDANEGLQRLVWNGRMPFEMQAVRAMPDGFEIEFTKPVDKKSAEDIASYSVESFIYKYHPVYGSPTVNNQKCAVKGVKVSDDGMKVRIIVDGLRQYYIHNITLEGIRDKEDAYSLVHPTAYYTLNNIPQGQKLSLSEVSTKNSAQGAKNKTAPGKTTSSKAGADLKGSSDPASKTATKNATKATAVTSASSFTAVKPLLIKYTCNACHNADKRQVGPAFKDVAKRKYSNDKIISLIHNPQPQNWPGYATEMPPMPQVPKEDARKIAAWINSLKE